MKKALLGGTARETALFLGGCCPDLFAAAVFLPRHVLLPRFTAELQDYIKEQFHAEEVEIDLAWHGSWSLLLGRVPEVEIVIADGSTAGLPIQSARLKAVDLRFHPWALFKERVLVCRL